ncbi:NAD(P)H-binding protein [Palleronia rufa]|uniref:NAD(P)H-binding protein n=1 Tax=Palleronia rufa TaxID=1530186 RepID=UPI0005694CA6|nr:NAD(P)H-binding protein [Palleronia rufa]
MARILIIGATGGVGARLIPLLAADAHEIHGLHRAPAQAKDLQRQGVTPHGGDLMEMSEDDYAALVSGMEVVVFSAGAAGSGADRTTEIDGNGPVKLIRAMEREGVTRLVLVSVFPEAGRDRAPSDGFEHYMACKKRADVAVAASGLDWVIVRPGTLQDADGDGMVRAGRAVPYGDVARGNVARLIAEVVATPALRREAIELTDGDTPVAEAVAALRRDG